MSINTCRRSRKVFRSRRWRYFIPTGRR